MQISGLVLDVYDDFGGDTLRALYPTQGDVPDTVKTASDVRGALRDQLPDDVFALVLVNNGETLRKYACVDPGNTELSVEYFLKHAHKLPAEAQKVAAANLQTACGWYDLPVPEELEKIALGLLGAAMAIPTVMGAAGAIKSNMGNARQAGGQLMSPTMLKAAEVNGTATMPMEPGSVSSFAQKTTINKTARVGHLVKHEGRAESLPNAQPIAGENHKEAPQAKHLRPTVDVSNATPPKLVTEKKASQYALEGEQRYPIDSYAQVKCAAEYFDKNYRFFDIEQRREYAVNVVKQASAMAIEVSDVTLRYGSQTLAPEAEIKIAFDARRSELQAYPEQVRLLNEVESVILTQGGMKLASIALHPREACELLAEFDRQTGLDRSYDKLIPDPYYSIYGETKTASKAQWSDLIGNDYVVYSDLLRLSQTGTKTVRDTFGEEFQEAFRKDPIEMYESLPRDQKKMVIHMANNTSPGAEPAY